MTPEQKRFTYAITKELDSLRPAARQEVVNNLELMSDWLSKIQGDENKERAILEVLERSSDGIRTRVLRRLGKFAY